MLIFAFTVASAIKYPEATIASHEISKADVDGIKPDLKINEGKARIPAPTVVPQTRAALPITF